MRLLFLDDYRQPPDDCFKYMAPRIGAEVAIYGHQDWYVVKNYPAFVQYIERNGLPDMISFDHDLADGHYHKNMQEGHLNYQASGFDDDYNKTGYHCAQWLVNYCIDNKKELPKYIVHSMNPVGTENIISLLESYKKSKSL